ncbi:TetR/AcrR family transcriptional regulator [uncultured Shewanella sp.]|uniref:TetR/AcrR family transcriptional regulator n=1 Tax=uncultured Shewanella sp. TaxID=173975 RepID=UPI002605E38D|nr:TetR/AcrR family transcriptional regulator [uncultured Shewanella sp.]
MLQPLVYVGRKASRKDGQARRIAILEATLAVIVQEGIRGVRHRAVAKQAQVPLASTTYYFSDIKCLISDALTYFAEKHLWMREKLEHKSWGLLSEWPAQCVQHNDKQQLIQALSDIACHYVQAKVAQTDDCIIEMAFHEEALRNPQLAVAVSRLNEAMLNSIERFLKQVGSKESASYIDAHQVLGVIKWLEYQYLVNMSAAQYDKKYLSRSWGCAWALKEKVYELKQDNMIERHFQPIVRAMITNAVG